MAKINDGGSAFPVERLHTEQRDGRWMDRWIPEGGMSLRDYFAGQAIIAIISKIPLLKDRDPRGVLPDVPMVKDGVGAEIQAGAATLAYVYADAMIAAREIK